MSSPLEAGPQLARQRYAVMATLRPDGSPHLSLVQQHHSGAEAAVSLTEDRVKTRNLRADPRAARLVHTDIYDEFVVAEGAVALSPPSHRPGDATGLALIERYRALAGEHPDWDDYLVAMVRDRRLLARLHVQRTYRGGAR